jgi:hypothetical protein
MISAAAIVCPIPLSNLALLSELPVTNDKYFSFEYKKHKGL